MFISVVIPVYKRFDWLEKCLSALLQQTYSSKKWEIVVVDDGSPNGDRIRHVIESFADKFPVSLALLRKQNAGPAAARNHGVQAARGEILCFLDDDSVPEPGWLGEIAAPFRGNERVGLVSGKTLSFNRQNNSLSLLLERAVYSGKCWATCNIAYRRSTFETLGGFDETFPEPSWEDNDLGLRARWAGFLHEFSEHAVVLHPHEESVPEYRDKCLLNGRGAAEFSRKYLRTRPLWSIAVPVLMSRRLICGFLPPVWFRQISSKWYLRFLWSLYSAQGYLAAMTGMMNGKDKAR